MSLVNHSATPIAWKPVREAGDRLLRSLNARVIATLCAGLLALVVAVTAAAAWLHPEYNWDMGPYIAVSLEEGISDPAALHAAAWEPIRERASEAQWYQLSAGNAYNLDLAQNPDNFLSQLPMYRVKVGYTAALQAAQGFVDPVTSTLLVNVAAALLVGGMLIIWMTRHGFAESAPFLIGALLLAGYFNMALLATPDLLMAGFGLVGIYLAVKGRPWAAAPFLMAMYLVRPDSIIFLFALLLASLAFGLYRLPFLLLFAAGLALHFHISAAAEHPGWWPHFYFSNVELQTSMEGFAPAFSVADYLKGVMRGVSVALRFNSWPMLLLVMLAGWLMLARGGRLADRRASMMLTALMLCFAGKFATFPLPDDRVYFLFVAAFAVILLEAWKPRLLPVRGAAPN